MKLINQLTDGLAGRCDVCITPSSFIWGFSLFNACVFHLPLLTYLSSNLEVTSSLGIGVLLVVLSISYLLMWILMGGFSLISTSSIKFLAIIVLLGNSLALYFMNTYQVILDKSMMGNVLNTDRDESWALLHPKLLIYILSALLVSLLLFKLVKLKVQSRLRRLGHLMIAIVLALCTVYLNSSSWLWVDKHAKMIGGLLLPWSYSLNTARYLSDQNKAQRQLEALPALQWTESMGSDNLPITVVLVIGESARSKNFSIYGYERETNPALNKQNLLVLKSAESCATYTTRSLECMLSHDPQASKLTHEILPNYLYRSGNVQVLWRSRNWGEPNLKFDSVVRSRSLSALCQPPDCLDPEQDAALLAGLEDQVKNASMGKQFIVLHQSGSHGPAYSTKYPVEFSKFQPVCDTVDIKKCSPQSLVNAYDNTILYTDHLLDQLIGMLKRQKHRRSVMIFISDHGESLGEGGWYLHGAPDMVAPREQKDIPFIVWMSDEFIHHFKLDVTKMQMSVNQPNDLGIVNGHHQIFHSVLGALGAKSSVYRSDFDIFKP